MTNEQQPNQPLTRRQLRELRSTGATPILTPEGTPIMPPAQATTAANEAKAPSDADDRQDVGQAPATADSADEASETGESAEPAASGGSVDPSREPAPAPAEESPAVADKGQGSGPSPSEPTPDPDGAPLTRRRARERTGNTDALAVNNPDGDHRVPFVSVPPVSPEEHPISQAAAGLASGEPAERGTVSPQLGSALLAGVATEPDPRPSFDQLISRPSAGSTGCSTWASCRSSTRTTPSRPTRSASVTTIAWARASPR